MWTSLKVWFCSILPALLLSKNGLEGEWCEFVAAALVELVLELDPVETKGVEETLQGIHAHEHTKGKGEEYKECEEELYVKDIKIESLTVIEPAVVPFDSKANLSTCSRNTAASWEWAKLKAQRRR